MADIEKVITELQDSRELTLAAIGRKYNLSYVQFLQVCVDDALELLKEYQGAKPLIDAISDSVHETAKMFRQSDGLKHYDDGSTES